MENVNTKYEGSQSELAVIENTRILDTDAARHVSMHNHVAVELKNQTNQITNELYSDLFKTRAHIGFKDWNKDMSTYLLGSRNNISIIDLKLTLINLRKTLKFLESLKVVSQSDAINLRQENYETTHKNFIRQMQPHILFVNTSNKFSELIKQVGFKTKQSFINERWVGGTLTNWKQSSESLFLYNKFSFLFDNFLKSSNIQIPVYQKLKKRYGGFDGYTDDNEDESLLLSKYNKSIVNNGAHSLPNNVSNIPKDIRYEYSRSTLPDVVILINPEENAIAIHEAQLLKIPIIAFADSNTVITGVSQQNSHRSKNFSKRFPGIDFIIPGNNKSLSFIYFCLNLISITLQKKTR